MDLFDGDFDSEDAAIFGGIAGFAEESIREENRTDDDVEASEESVKSESSKETSLRRMYNTNPSLFNHIVRLVVRHRKSWRKIREQKELELDQVGHELEAMKETEVELEE